MTKSIYLNHQKEINASHFAINGVIVLNKPSNLGILSLTSIEVYINEAIPADSKGRT